MKRYMTRQLAASIIGLVLLGGAGFAQVSAQEVAPAPVDSSEISNIGRDYRIALSHCPHQRKKRLYTSSSVSDS